MFRMQCCALGTRHNGCVWVNLGARRSQTVLLRSQCAFRPKSLLLIFLEGAVELELDLEL